MGFTPLEGLVMATRSGSVDPGLLLWLLEHGRLSPTELADALEHESGLLGLAGTADMREVLGAGRRGETRRRSSRSRSTPPSARRASRRWRRALGGLDALAFTGGVGERVGAIRARAAVDGLGFLGARGRRGAQRARARATATIGRVGAARKCSSSRAREDLEIARQVRELLGAGG